MSGHLGIHADLHLHRNNKPNTTERTGASSLIMANSTAPANPLFNKAGNSNHKPSNMVKRSSLELSLGMHKLCIISSSLRLRSIILHNPYHRPNSLLNPIKHNTTKLDKQLNSQGQCRDTIHKVCTLTDLLQLLDL